MPTFSFCSILNEISSVRVWETCGGTEAEESLTLKEQRKKKKKGHKMFYLIQVDDEWAFLWKDCVHLVFWNDAGTSFHQLHTQQQIQTR